MCVYFGTADATLSGDVDNDVEENAFGLENVRSHVENLWNKLSDVSQILHGSAEQQEALKKLAGHIDVYNYHKERDYEHILMRRKKIENYKENSENLKQEKIQQAQAEASRKEEIRRAEELKRLEYENKENEKRRRLAEQVRILLDFLSC